MEIIHSEIMSPKDLAMEYYRRLDAGSPDLMDIFHDDAEFYFPKFGISSGKSTFFDLLTGLGKVVTSIGHHLPDFKLNVLDNIVVVEGTTFGTLSDGTAWNGGETPGGRFCSVFEVRNGLITRMYVYLDPDYGSADRERFLWPESDARRW